ncbi:unnamed protein product [Linum tenue]|uniref:Uncharacterized protein n=1 Tax=Linum tenue TaxID=586396 RepID=A0AAV0ITS1_9ROSI|nr:unnamed protein product [Linum tenue]
MGRGFEFYFGPFSLTYTLGKGFSWRTDFGPLDRAPNALVSSEKAVMDYFTEFGVPNQNIKTVKLVKPKFPKDPMARYCNTILENFAESLMDDGSSLEILHEKLIQYCGVEIEYQQGR